ncbi:MAG: hypothetical protein GX858_07825 [Clostridiales bacterium]|nr:hypothetical protein [Clostridiales bacterium]
MNIKEIITKAERDCADVFSKIDELEAANTRRVLALFQKHRVASHHFAGSEGYGYGDIGRETLEAMVADLFNTQAAIFRPQIASGTHALSLCLFGLLKPNEHLLSAFGDPYDTLADIIGLHETVPGSLAEMGISYSKVEPRSNGELDTPAILAALEPNTRVILVQRSRGYSLRKSLQPCDMAELFAAVKKIRPDIYLFVDNCYGAFTTQDEPTDYGADVVAGSLIKNLGGGLAPTGGYIAGTQLAIDRIASRLTAPGIGLEVGSYQPGYRLFFQGLFMAPHTVAQALKTAVLAARACELLGMKTTPAFDEQRSDIIQAIAMADEKQLILFCQGIQAASPIDSFAVPEPWAMPG